MKTRRIVIWLCCISIVSSMPVIAQKIYPGITAGASVNNMKLKGVPDNIKNPDNVKGVEAGLYLQLTAGNFYIRPMVVAGFLRGTVNSISEEAQNTETNFNLTTLEVPVQAGVHLLPFLAIEAGPSWNYLMNYTDKIYNVDLDLNRNSFGYRAGVRLVFSRTGVFGHYGGIIEDFGNADYTLNRPSRIVLGATLKLGDKN